MTPLDAIWKMVRQIDSDIEKTEADLVNSYDTHPGGDPYLMGVLWGLKLANRRMGAAIPHVVKKVAATVDREREYEPSIN